MNEQWELRAVWGSRRETAESSVDAMAQCLKALHGVDEAFAQWFNSKGASSPAIARCRPLSVTTTALATLFEEQARTGGEGTENYGYSVTIWNGVAPNEGITLDIRCGAWSNWVSFPNRCSLWLPREGAVLHRLLSRKVACDLLYVITDTWDPDLAWITSTSIFNAAFPTGHRGVWIGPIAYVSGRYGALPALPESVAFYARKRGSVMVMGKADALRAADEEALGLIRTVGAKLRNKGILERSA